MRGSGGEGVSFGGLRVLSVSRPWTLLANVHVLLTAAVRGLDVSEHYARLVMISCCIQKISREHSTKEGRTRGSVGIPAIPNKQ